MNPLGPALVRHVASGLGGPLKTRAAGQRALAAGRVDAVADVHVLQQRHQCPAVR